MTGSDTLDRIEQYRDRLDAAVSDPDLSLEVVESDLVLDNTNPLMPDELHRAKALLADILELEARMEGLRTRLAGEIADARRPRRDSYRRAPRVLDTKL